MFTPLELVGRVHASNSADPIRILLPDSDLENGRFGSDPYEIINSTGTVFCLLVHCSMYRVYSPGTGQLTGTYLS